MTDPALIERITRSLAFMLRHQPESFDLELDPQGFAVLDDVVHALNERLGEPVEDEDVTTAVRSGDRPRYEIQGDRIRALYGHSIPVEPGPSSKPPELLYVAVPEQELDRARRFGLRGGRRRFLHLATSLEDAMESGRRAARDYTVLVVRALDAWEDGISFYDRQALWLAEEIPTHLLQEEGTYHDGTNPAPRHFSGGRERESESRDRDHGGRDRDRDRDGRRGGRGRHRGRRRERGPEPVGERGLSRPAHSGGERTMDEAPDAGVGERVSAAPEAQGRTQQRSEHGFRGRDERDRGPRRGPREQGRERVEEPAGRPEARREEPREERRDDRRDERRDERRERPSSPAPSPAAHAAPRPERPARANTGGFGAGLDSSGSEEREPRREQPRPPPPPRRDPPPPAKDSPGFGAGL